MSQVRVYPDPMNRADQVIYVPREHPLRVDILEAVSNVLNVPGHESESDEVQAAINWTGEEMAPRRGESDQQNLRHPHERMSELLRRLREAEDAVAQFRRRISG